MIAGEPFAWRSRVLIAAGAMGDLTVARPAWLAGVDAAITRSIGLRGAGGRARVVEAAAGLMTARPYPVQSLEGALRLAQPAWARLVVPVIVSIWAAGIADAATLAHELAPLPNVVALELNLLAADGTAETPLLVSRATEAAAVAGLPLIVKLSPPGDVVSCARAAAASGAWMLDLGHGWPAAFADGVPAFLSGPAVAPQTAAVVRELVTESALPVIAAGGVASAVAARRLLAAGAAAAAIGAALLRDPSVAARIAAELAAAVP